MAYWGLLAIVGRFIRYPKQLESAARNQRLRRILILTLTPILLLAGAGQVLADSPPNPTTDIPWNAGVSGVADVEAAFNHGRREEEKQLGLAAGTLGNLDLPSQTVWDATSDDIKALTIMNAERVDRAGMKPGVIGLPFQAVQTDVDNLAQYYADYLVDNNTSGHTADGRTAFKRIDDDPALGPCHEFLHRAENLGYFNTTASTVPPVTLESLIYWWIYNDASQGWGHREAVLLQDKALGYSDPQYGFNNNVGSMADEGFIGIGVASSPNWNPFGSPGSKMGYVLVMDMIDPISTGTCPWDLGPTVSGITPNTGANTGTVQITNLAGSNFQPGATVKLKKSGQSDIVATNVQVVSGSKITCNLNLAGVAAGQWDVVVTNPGSASGKLTNGFTVTVPAGGPTVTSITPSTGENTGWLLITDLIGTGFQNEATVKLQKSGQPDIVASSVKWVSETKMTCALDLTGAATGAWDVVVTNPDTKSGKLTSGFTVTGSTTGPTITSITPNAGPNTGPIQITNLAGSGFQAGATVKLSRPGETDIVGTNVQVVSASQIKCVFDLAGTLGVYRWDVVVTNPGSQSATLPNGFRITKPAPPMPYAALLPVMMRAQAGETTVRFVAGADTTILQGDPNTYFGAEESMWTGYDVCWNYQIARSLFGFNVTSIPAGATIDKATLHLVHNHTCHWEPSSHTVTAYRIGSDWNTGTVTWNTQPSQAGSYGQVVVTTSPFQQYSMDVTSLVRGWVNGTFPNLGVMLRGPESSSGQPTVVGFATRQYEQGEFAAVLEVTYRGGTASGKAAELGGFGPGVEMAPLGGGNGPGVLPHGVR